MEVCAHARATLVGPITTFAPEVLDSGVAVLRVLGAPGPLARVRRVRNPFRPLTAGCGRMADSPAAARIRAGMNPLPGRPS